MSDEDEARGFALEHAHYREDLPFWRAAAARLGGPVLDVGAASGRVALALARDGHEVWALDRSPAMLGELSRALGAEPPAVRARVRPVAGDMRELSLGRRFPMVMVAMNTLQTMLTEDDRRACMRGLAAHLAPEGELIFDVALPDPEEIEGSLGLPRDGEVHRDPVAGTLRHSAWYDRWDPAEGTLEFTLRIDHRPPERAPRTILRRHRVHLYGPEEVSRLLAGAGLVAISVSGDFAGTPLAPGHERQVYRCRGAAT